MGVTESIKGFYFSLEDHYYGFLDWLDGKGIPIYSIVDPIESAGIPSFPIIIILILAILVLVGWLLMGNLFVGNGTITVTVLDEQSQPIPNAIVAIKVADKEPTSFPSDPNGKVEKTFPIGTDLSITVSKDGYAAKTISLKVEQPKNEKSVTLTATIQMLTRTVNLKDASGAQYSKPVLVHFSCTGNSGFNFETTSVNGSIVVTNIPPDCGSLTATPKTTGVSFQQGIINLAEPGTASLAVQEQAQETGTVKATIKDSQGNPIAGANVKLMHEDGTQLTPRTSDASGVALFEKVPVGKYYIIVTYYDSKYGEYNSSALSPPDIREVTPNGTVEFTATLQEVVKGKIKLSVTDAVTKQPVSKAKVTLLKNKVELEPKYTDDTGYVEFAVGETGTIYSVRIDHQAYLIESMDNLAPSDSTILVQLKPVSPDQATVLEVLVVDSDTANAQPVENARVQLKKSASGEMASDAIATGVDGKATFLRLPPDSYFAVVNKEGFESVTSDIVAVEERRINSVKVVLRIGSGTIALLVSDESQQALSGAKIQLVDAFSGKVLEEGLSATDGKKSFTVRADKTVFFRTTAADFASFTTIPYTAPVDSTREVKVQLVKDIVKLEASFQGLFIGDEAVTDSLSAGQRYTARFELLVPESVEWDEAGIHIRTGAFDDGKTNLMESDFLYLGKSWSAANAVLRGKSFSPPAGFSEDSKHLTTGNSKWINASFSKAKGAYQIEVEVQVLDTAPTSSLLPISYRAFGKSGGTVVRNPMDQTLGSGESASGKQGLFAKTNDRFFTVGPSTLCDDQFCRLFVIQDVRADLRNMVVDEYPATISSDYKLFFTLVNKSPLTFSGSQLEIANEEAGLAFGNYKVTDAQGKIVSGNANGDNKISLNVADMGKDSSLFGEVAFSTKKEGTNGLKIVLKSNQQNVFDKTLNIHVAAASQMDVDVLPKSLAPFLDNDLLVKISDHNSGKGISNAIVELFVNNERVASGSTNAEGVFQYTLQSPAPGWNIKISAQKTGFALVSKEMKVSSNILTIVPDAVNESLTVTGTFGFEKDFILVNNTSQPMTLKEITVSSEFEKFVTITSTDNIQGQVLGPGKDTNFLIRVELTDAGKMLLEPVQLKGTLTIFTILGEKTWANTIPFNIFIGFGGEVLDQNCLFLDPAGWSIFTASTENKVLPIKITNKCKADQSYVALHDIQVRVQMVGSDNPLGSFLVSSDLPGSRIVGLNEKFQSLAPEIAANADPTLTLTFAPGETIKAGKSTARIIVQGSHTTAKGVQPIVAVVTVDTSVNDLSACLQVAPTNLIVHSTPPGTGFNLYSSYGYGGSTYLGAPQQYGGTSSGFGRFDFTGNQNQYYNNYLNGTQTIDGNPTQVDYPERLYATNYPYAGYSEPFYDTWAPVASNGAIPGYTGYRGPSADYFGQQFGTFNYANSFYGRNNQFKITNTCSSAVEITLDADPALLVNQNSFKLEPDKQQIVPIESAYYYGQYPLNVKAKLAGSKDNSQVVQTLNVNVLPADDPTQYDNCIRLSTTKFKFNDFMQKPVTAKVYNSCYGQGVRLDYDSISFTNMGYGEQLARQSGSPGIVEAIEPVNLITMPGTMGSGSQVLEFEIIKNIEYRPQLMNGPIGTGGPQDIMGFRNWASGAYNRVQARAQLVVRYSTPQGLEQRKVFRVIVEDFWNIFNTLPIQVPGNPFITAKDCLIEDALDYGACITESDFKGEKYEFDSRQILRIGSNPYDPSGPRIFSGNPINQGNAASGTRYGGLYQSPGGTPYSAGNLYNQIYQPTYAPTAQPQPYPYYAPNYSVPSGYPYGTGYGNLPPELLNVCGTMDRITLRTQPITKNDIKFTFSIGSGKGEKSQEFVGQQKIKLTVDKSGATQGGETKLETKIEVEVSRQTPLGIDHIKVPVSVCVDLKKAGPGPTGPGTPIVPVFAPTPNPQTPATLLCEGGEKATDATSFKQILLDWDWSLGSGTGDKEGARCAPTEDGKYCDAVQNTIGLVKRAMAIQSKLKEIKSSLSDNKPNVAAALAIIEEKAKDYADTKNLLRWSKEQKMVLDNASQKEGVFEFEKEPAAAEQKIVFFYKKPESDKKELNELLDLGKINPTTESKIQAAVTDFRSAPSIEKMPNLLTQLSSITNESAIDKKGIVLVITAWTNTDASDYKNLQQLGAEPIYLNEKEKKNAILVLTLNEFSYLHQQLKKCPDLSESSCEMEHAGSEGGKITITTDFLSNLLNHFEAKQVARHTTKELDNPATDYYQFVKDNAAWKTGIQPEIIEQVFSLMDKNALLIRDNYSKKFQEAFAAYYGSKAERTNGDTSAQGLASKVSQWEFSGDTKVTGMYHAFINYNWEKETSKIAFTPPKEEIQQGNILYYLPFDASLQEQNDDATDYGTALNGEGRNEFLLNFKADKTGDKLLANSKRQSLSLDYRKDLSNAETTRGKLLGITSTQLVFSPTTPFGFVLSGMGTNNGVLFTFKNVEALNGKTVWSGFTEGKGTPNGVCKNSKGDTQFSLLTQDTKGVLYVPIGMQQSGPVLSLVCAATQATMQVRQGTLFSQLGDAFTTESGTVTKEAQKDFDLKKNPNESGRINLKALIEAIKNKHACVKATKDSLEIFWNPADVSGGSLAAGTGSPNFTIGEADLKKKD